MNNWKHIALVRADDWCALYIDGKKVIEGHNISDYDWMRLLGGEVLWAQGQADELGCFPETFDEVEPDE